MSDIDPKKLKVTELREELKSRGLDTKGNKNQLVKRLEQALAKDSGEAVDDSINESAQDESVLETTTEETGQESDPQPVVSEPEPTVEPEKACDIEQQAADPEEAEQEAPMEAEPEPEATEPEPEATEAEPQAVDQEAEPQKEQDAEIPPEESMQEDDENAAEVTETSEPSAEQPAEAAVEGEAAAEGEADEGVPIEGEFQVMDSVGDTEGMDAEDDKRGEKRRRSRSRDRDRDRYGRRHEESAKVEEKDDWLQSTNVQLDRFNCDLNMRIREDGSKANPITVEGFAFMWSGARATYGVKTGKIAYEVKILEHLNVDHLPPEETHLHVTRVGWSLDSTSFQLGEEKFSYGFGGTGKASVECKFQDYGEKFAAGDVIGAYLDLESDPIEMSYTKNGEDLGKCFEIEKSTLEDQAIFPHILSKNCEFECNFGEKESPFFPLKEGYTWINDVPVEERVRGMLPNTKKEECEIIMMCGLPAAGKTHWATKHAEENKDKRFNVLGTNNIIDKMKVMGLPRKKNYAGRWDVLIDKSTRCLNRLLEIASQKKRNYILDQTNVYPSAQRRKMRPFEGFQRKSVVIVPTDEEFKRRTEKREKEEGKDVPDTAVLEMKANFALPEEGTLFDKVEFVELDREEAAKLVEKYNKEGRDALPPPEKRFRDNRHGSSYGVPTVVGRDYNRDNRYNSRGGGGGRGYGGRGNYNDRRGTGSGDRRGGSYMGYSNSDRRRYDDRNDRRDNRGKSGSSYDNRNSRSSSYSKSGSGSWGNNQGNWGNQSSWSGSGQGSWGNQGNWGNQNYQSNWGGQWSGYQGQGQGQGWGQNYNYNWPSQGNWGSNYNQSQGSNNSSWGSSSYGSGSSYHK